MQDQDRNGAWRVVTLLMLANVVNLFDRSLAGVVAEPLRKEWGLSDLQLGIISAAFILVYAVAVVPMGRWADTRSRTILMGVGILAWSAFTGLSGIAWGFVAFLVFRIGVGVGEASFGPASTAMIADLFPSNKRSLPLGVFNLGSNIGSLLAFFLAGPLIQMFGSWRAPFFVALVPGVIIAICIFFVKEPKRGAADAAVGTSRVIDKPIRKVLATTSIRWVVAAGMCGSMAIYAAAAFLVPMVQRYFEVPLTQAASVGGIIMGIVGMISLTLGGAIADKLQNYDERARLAFGGGSLILAAILILVALRFGRGELVMFTVVYSLASLMYHNLLVTIYPAIQDLVVPQLRATAFAVVTALSYILGGGIGPLLVGGMSDHFSKAAMVAANATEMTDQIKGVGLHDSMHLVPVILALSGICMLIAMRTFRSDAAKVREEMKSGSIGA